MSSCVAFANHVVVGSRAVVVDTRGYLPCADASTLRHTTLATARLRFLFVAAKIWRHAGRTGVSYSDHYEERGLFQGLMDRLRAITVRGSGFAPVLAAAFT